MGGWAHELGWVWAKRLAGRILDCTGCIWSGLGVWGKHRDVQGEWAVCTNVWVYGLGVLTKCWVYGICVGAGLCWAGAVGAGLGLGQGHIWHIWHNKV